MAVLLTSVGVSAQNSGRRSPIVVGIVVNGLSEDYLQRLAPYFSESGFKRLMNTGLAIPNLDYGPDTDAASATAILYTGAAPSVNGVPASVIYDLVTNAPRHVLFDAGSIGNFTDETLSPAAIPVSTISDELKIDTDGHGFVYSIAPDSHQAIISAGHAGNGAFWLNDRNGSWATSTFYRDVPRTVTDRNYLNPLSKRIDTMKWEPMYPPAVYPSFTHATERRPFKHTFPRKSSDRYFALKSTPIVNTEVTDLAVGMINSQQLGSDSEPDMLNITYNLDLPGASPVELADAYLRLDRDLSRVLAAADMSAGRGRATVFLAGIPGSESTETDYLRFNIPTGEFSVKKAESLLNLYLIALHGNGDWVSGYHRRHFFLNRKLIKDRGLDLSDFRREVADFLIRMAGVSDAYTIDDVTSGRAGENPAATRRNISVAHSGDVIIAVNPGWKITDDGTAGQPQQQRVSTGMAPAYIIGPEIAPRRIETPVDARALAPTVVRAIHIRSPNGAAIPAISVK